MRLFKTLIQLLLSWRRTFAIKGGCLFTLQSAQDICFGAAEYKVIHPFVDEMCWKSTNRDCNTATKAANLSAIPFLIRVRVHLPPLPCSSLLTGPAPVSEVIVLDNILLVKQFLLHCHGHLAQFVHLYCLITCLRNDLVGGG